MKAGRRTVADFLDEWHRAVRPTAAVHVGELPRLPRCLCLAVIGETAMQDLTPIRLNLLYGHLLERAG